MRYGMRLGRLSGVALALMLLVLAGCGGSDAEQATPSPESSAAAETARARHRVRQPDHPIDSGVVVPRDEDVAADLVVDVEEPARRHLLEGGDDPSGGEHRLAVLGGGAALGGEDEWALVVEPEGVHRVHHDAAREVQGLERRRLRLERHGDDHDLGAVDRVLVRGRGDGGCCCHVPEALDDALCPLAGA
jgi:hypothetical protein